MANSKISKTHRNITYFYGKTSVVPSSIQTLTRNTLNSTLCDRYDAIVSMVSRKGGNECSLCESRDKYTLY